MMMMEMMGGEGGAFPESWMELGPEIKLESLSLKVVLSLCVHERFLEALADPAFCPSLCGGCPRSLTSGGAAKWTRRCGPGGGRARQRRRKCRGLGWIVRKTLGSSDESQAEEEQTHHVTLPTDLFVWFLCRRLFSLFAFCFSTARAYPQPRSVMCGAWCLLGRLNCSICLLMETGRLNDRSINPAR